MLSSDKPGIKALFTEENNFSSPAPNFKKRDNNMANIYYIMSINKYNSQLIYVYLTRA